MHAPNQTPATISPDYFSSLEAALNATGSPPFEPLLCSRVLFGRDAVAEQWAEVNPRTMPSPQGQAWFENLVETAKGIKNPKPPKRGVEEIDPTEDASLKTGDSLWPTGVQDRLKKQDERTTTKLGENEPPEKRDFDPKTKKVLVGFDIWGWYCAAHRYTANSKGRSEWGAYCPPEGVACVAKELTASGLCWDDAIRVAALKLYYHECAHGLIEDLVFLTEPMPAKAPGLDGNLPNPQPRYLQRTKLGHLREEAFCNSVALACLRRDFGFTDARCNAVIALMDTQGAGYRYFARGIPSITDRDAQKTLAGMAWSVLTQYGPNPLRKDQELIRTLGTQETDAAKLNDAERTHRSAVNSAIALVFGVVLPAETDAVMLIARRPWATTLIPVITKNHDPESERAPGSTRWADLLAKIPGATPADLIKGYDETKWLWRKLPADWLEPTPICLADILGEALTAWMQRRVKTGWIAGGLAAHPYSIHLAASLDLDEQIQSYQTGRYDPNEKDAVGLSPIHYAAIEGRPKAINALRSISAKPNEKNRPVIVAGFPGVGKTTFANKHSTRIVDVDAGNYLKGPSPRYSGLSQIDPIRIVDEVGKKLKQPKVEMIFVSTHHGVLRELESRGLHYVLTFPRETAKADYLNRYQGRQEKLNYHAYLQKHWDELWQETLTACRFPGCKGHVLLPVGQGVSDVENNINEIWEKAGNQGEFRSSYQDSHDSSEGVL